MPDQTAFNVQAYAKRQSAKGTAATVGAGADMIRLIDSEGLSMDPATYQSGEGRADLVQQMPASGMRSGGGTINTEFHPGGFTDGGLEAAMRRAWSAALAITPATSGFTSATLTVATSGSNQTITTSAGSWLTAGLMVGDIITPTGLTQTASNNIRLRIVALSATAITVAGTELTAGATASGWTITRAKKLTTAGTPTEYWYTFEQWDADVGVDVSELFTDHKIIGISLSARPGFVTLAWTVMGIDAQLLSSAASPYFTPVTVTTTQPMIFEDALWRFNGAELPNPVGFDLTIGIDAALQAVGGQRVSSGVYTNRTNFTASIMSIRQDLTHRALMDARTEVEFEVLFRGSGTAPLDAIAFYLPRVTVGATKAPLRGSAGPKIQTTPLLIGPKTAATGYDGSALNIFSTAA